MDLRSLLIGALLGILLGSVIGYAANSTNTSQIYCPTDPIKDTQITQLNQQLEEKNSQLNTLQEQVSTLQKSTLTLIAASFPRADDTSTLVATWIGKANTTIDIAIYSFTRDSTADALIAAKNRGVKIRVLMELENIGDDGSEYTRLKAAGIIIEPDKLQGLMHNKFFIIDGKIVGTGSYNWTSAAENANAENLLIINSSNLATRYTDEFNELWPN